MAPVVVAELDTANVLWTDEVCRAGRVREVV